MPRSSILHADKGYDSNAIRRQVEEKGAMPNIPPKANQMEKLLLAIPLSHPQCRRAHLRAPEKLPPHCDPLRSPHRQLPRRNMPRRGGQLLVMSRTFHRKRALPTCSKFRSNFLGRNRDRFVSYVSRGPLG